MKGKFISEGSSTGPGSTDGDTTGFSFGLDWTNQMTDKFSYTLGFKVNQYKFEDTALTGSDDLSSDENFVITYLKISNYF